MVTTGFCTFKTMQKIKRCVCKSAQLHQSTEKSQNLVSRDTARRYCALDASSIENGYPLNQRVSMFGIWRRQGHYNRETCISHKTAHGTTSAHWLLSVALGSRTSTVHSRFRHTRRTTTLRFVNASFPFERLALCVNRHSAVWFLVKLCAKYTSHSCCSRFLRQMQNRYTLLQWSSHFHKQWHLAAAARNNNFPSNLDENFDSSPIQ